MVEQFDGYSRTCFSICKGMMVVLQVITTTLCNDVKIMMTTRPVQAVSRAMVGRRKCFIFFNSEFRIQNSELGYGMRLLT